MSKSDKNKKITGSQAIIKALINEGVDTVFGYPGGAIMPFYDALYDAKDEIKHILVRHEQGASHAAEGYARITGRAGVCIATSGPGATNLVTGIADAMLDSVPMVCITGQVFSDLLGTDAFQETDVIGITMPITKWNYQVSRAEDIAEAISKAFYIAQNGRPGPVLVDITKDAQVNSFEYEAVKVTSIKNFNPMPSINDSRIKEAAEAINNAKRPLIFCGHGVLIAQAQKELTKIMEVGDIPATSTLHGLSAIATSHPQYVGMLGMHGHYGPNLLSKEADVVIAVGMRFDDRVTGKLKTFIPDATVIHIDIDAAELHKNVKAHIPVHGDAKVALTKLLPLIEKRNRSEWIAAFAKCDEEEKAKVAISGDGEKLKMSEVIVELSKETKGEAVIVADVGQHQMMAARYYQFQKPDSFITSGGLGTMGFALPAAIGAKEAAKDREVVAIIGDGSFQMTLQELATIKQENLAVKVIILNNNFLGMVRQWQELFFDNRYSFVDLDNPDFVKVTEGFGIKAQRIEKKSELEAGLKTMLEHDGPFLLEVMVEKEQNVFPMVPAGACVSDIRLE